MFVWSVRASTLKFIAVLIVSVAAVGALAVFMPKYDARTVMADQTAVSFRASGAEDVKSFLSQYGWEATDLLDTADVTIPAQFDPVYENYNALQTKQGFDLSKYRKKTVTRYTYRIVNYPDYSGVVIADVIVYKNRIIGGDVCSADINGFVHGFKKDVTM